MPFGMGTVLSTWWKLILAYLSYNLNIMHKSFLLSPRTVQLRKSHVLHMCKIDSFVAKSLVRVSREASVLKALMLMDVQ